MLCKQMISRGQNVKMHLKPLMLQNHSVNRYLQTTEVKVVSKLNYMVVSEAERQEYMSIFPQILQDLADTSIYADIQEPIRQYAKVLKYNVEPSYKYGMAALAAYKAFESLENLTPENIRLANVLSWAVDLTIALFIITDDIEDGSEYRYGAPCWYKVEGVGLQAINDAQMVANGFHIILKKYFSGHHCYIPAIELYNDVIMRTLLGASLEFMCLRGGKPDLNSFTLKRFSTIAKYKIYFVVFKLPVALAMCFAGRYDTETYKQVSNVLQGIAHIHQADNDFFDCFAEVKSSGKNGTDIAEGRCTWLAVTALQQATPAQRKFLEQNYGRREPECEASVRNLYQEMNLLDAYTIYREKKFKHIRGLIEQMSKDLPREFFLKLQKQIYTSLIL